MARQIRVATVEEFLSREAGIPLVDVRTPSEFKKGHIPGAFNIPLFNDRQRADVGTSYKQKGSYTAILKGLDFVGPEMSRLLQEGVKLAGKRKKLYIHCWRGGMRSSSMAWLFSLGGVESTLLEGGYKNYRNYILDKLGDHYRLIVVGGLTGSGKTEVLKYIEATGEQVIDLEGMANHRGSAFGAIGLPPQPGSEQFGNNLYLEISRLNRERRIFVEDESLNIGSVFMPEPFYRNIRKAPVLALMPGPSVRIARLMKEYGKLPPDKLEESIVRIRKRLGGQLADEAIESLHTGKTERAIEIVLAYYDRTYLFGLGKREKESVTLIDNNSGDAEVNAKLVLERADSLKL